MNEETDLELYQRKYIQKINVLGYDCFIKVEIAKGKNVDKKLYHTVSVETSEDNIKQYCVRTKNLVKKIQEATKFAKSYFTKKDEIICEKEKVLAILDGLGFEPQFPRTHKQKD